MAKKTTLYFATDVHGSERCFRKYLNAAAAYRPDAMVLGGDVAGKAVQAIESRGGGKYATTFRGKRFDADGAEELEEIKRMISDLGYYPYVGEPGELQERIADGSVDDLLEQVMLEGLERWMRLAEERLKPLEMPVFWMLGNDDPPSLKRVLDECPWGESAEGRLLDLGGYTLISWGFSNHTPWDSFREMSEEDLTAKLDELFAQAEDPRSVILNAHVPPFDSGLDEAPMLDADLTVEQQAGQVKLGPVGSTAVRAAIERYEPIVSLHGHVHESAGFRRIGETLAVNPGSDYGTGALNGALITLSRGKVKAHQLVRG